MAEREIQTSLTAKISFWIVKRMKYLGGALGLVWLVLSIIYVVRNGGGSIGGAMYGLWAVGMLIGFLGAWGRDDPYFIRRESGIHIAILVLGLVIIRVIGINVGILMSFSMSIALSWYPLKLIWNGLFLHFFLFHVSKQNVFNFVAPFWVLDHVGPKI